MKKIIVFIALAAITKSLSAQVCTPPQPIDTKAAIGIWEGHYLQQGENKTLRIEFREVNGQLESYVDMPDRGIKNTKFEVSICSSMDFHLKKTGIDNTTLQLVGKPNGNKISGHFKVGNSCPGITEAFSVTKNAALMSKRMVE